MQVVGFNFTKISGEMNEPLKSGKISANIEFTKVEKQKLDILKEAEAVKIDFSHSLDYESNDEKEKGKKASLLFEGNMLLSLDKEETKELLKDWKKKKIPMRQRLFLSNLILKKCAPKALLLQDDLALHSHIPIPSITEQKQN